MKKLKKYLHETKEDIKAFPNKVRHYLENELGPISAFSPIGASKDGQLQSDLL